MKKPLENRWNLILGFTFIFYQDCRGHPLVGVRLGRMVKKLCLGIEVAKPEDKEFCVIDTVEFGSEGFNLRVH